MGKTLIGCDCVEQHICHENNTIHVTRSMILTCGAKDYLRNKGTSIVYGEKPLVPVNDKTLKSKPRPAEETAQGSDLKKADIEKLMEKVITILKNEHGITDAETVKEICLKVLTKLNSN